MSMLLVKLVSVEHRAPRLLPQPLRLQRSEVIRVVLGRGGWEVRRRKKMGGRAL